MIIDKRLKSNVAKYWWAMSRTTSQLRNTDTQMNFYVFLFSLFFCKIVCIRMKTSVACLNNCNNCNCSALHSLSTMCRSSVFYYNSKQMTRNDERNLAIVSEFKSLWICNQTISLNWEWKNLEWFKHLNLEILIIKSREDFWANFAAMLRNWNVKNFGNFEKTKLIFGKKIVKFFIRKEWRGNF